MNQDWQNSRFAVCMNYKLLIRQLHFVKDNHDASRPLPICGSFNSFPAYPTENIANFYEEFAQRKNHTSSTTNSILTHSESSSICKYEGRTQQKHQMEYNPRQMTCTHTFTTQFQNSQKKASTQTYESQSTPPDLSAHRWWAAQFYFNLFHEMTSCINHGVWRTSRNDQNYKFKVWAKNVLKVNTCTINLPRTTQPIQKVLFLCVLDLHSAS